MNLLKLLFCIVVCLSCHTLQPEKTATKQFAIIQRLDSLLKQGEYFKLKTEIDKNKVVLPTQKQLYYEAYTESAFNRYSISNQSIAYLLERNQEYLTDSSRVNLMLLLRDNYFKSFQYDKAADIGRELLHNHQKTLGDRAHDVQNTLLIHEALRSIPPQQVFLKKVRLPWRSNQIGLIEIPIKTNTATLGIVFDTRAHISTVTQSFARKLGLKMLDVSFEESSGITGIKFKSGLGIADSLYLGDILIRHVVFQVLPDEQLHFPSIGFTLDGILGFPVITQLKEVHISKSGDFMVLPDAVPGGVHNMAFDGSTTIISVTQHADTLSFHFDTGATGTELYSNYFNQYTSDIIATGKVDSVESGGVGGNIKSKVYILPKIQLTIGEKNAELKDIAVRTTPAFKGQKYNGNIGQDVIKQFNEMILNFESMYLLFK
jgi:hypothetical protein